MFFVLGYRVSLFNARIKLCQAILPRALILLILEFRSSSRPLGIYAPLPSFNPPFYSVLFYLESMGAFVQR